MKFDEGTHTYTHNNENYISVTQLLQQYNLSADYANIDPVVLAKAAARGKQVHKDLENYINSKGTITASTAPVKELSKYIALRNIDLSTAKTEEVVYDEFHKIAGTIDFQYYDDVDRVVADFKTTATLHVDSVAWQLSIYNYILCAGDITSYYFNKLKVFHFTRNKLVVKDIYTVDYEQVEALINAYLNNDPSFVYNPITNIITNTQEQYLTQVLTEIKEHEEFIKTLKKQMDIVLDKAKEKFIQTKQYSLKTDNVLLSYVGPVTRATLDKTKVEEFLKQHNETIENYYKETTSPDSVRIKLVNQNKD